MAPKRLRVFAAAAVARRSAHFSPSPSAASTRVLMYACVHVPYGGPTRGPMQPGPFTARTHPLSFVLYGHRQPSIKRPPSRSTALLPIYHLPYSRGISSFASDRDSLPYCLAIGRSPSTKFHPPWLSPPSLLAPLSILAPIFPPPGVFHGHDRS